MSTELVPVTDYGLGSFKRVPIVLWVGAVGDVYHCSFSCGPWGGTFMTTEESYMRNHCGLLPCKQCFPGGATS